MSCYPDDEEYYNDNWDDPNANIELPHEEWQDLDWAPPDEDSYDYPDDSNMEEEGPDPYEQ